MADVGHYPFYTLLRGCSTDKRFSLLIVQRLLDGLKPHVLPRLVDPEGKGSHRIMISTPLPESSVAEYLTTLAARVEPHGVKVGSYPRWGRKRNTVTLVGRYVVAKDSLLLFYEETLLGGSCMANDILCRDQAYLESLVAEAEEAVQGKRVSKEDELDEPADKTEKKL
jgi:hypothetical protein